jgi:Domain of unknown function (DUF397)
MTGAMADRTGAPLEDDQTGRASLASRWRDAHWATSSRCASESCVQVARLTNGDTAVRDGKQGDASPVLVFTQAEWGAFTAGIQAGELL